MPRYDLTRRGFLARAAALPAFLRLAVAEAQTTGTRLILLGTGGGPRPRKASSGSAQVIIVNGLAYVIDCGDGVARQLAFADVPPAASFTRLSDGAVSPEMTIDRSAVSNRYANDRRHSRR